MKTKIIGTIIFFIGLCLILIVGCDKMKCKPDGKIDYKKGGVYGGFKCGGEW